MSGSVRDDSGPWTLEGGVQETRKGGAGNPEVRQYFGHKHTLFPAYRPLKYTIGCAIAQRIRQQRLEGPEQPPEASYERNTADKTGQKKNIVFNFFFVGSENCSGGEKNYFKSSRGLKQIKFICKKLKSRKIQKLFFV